MTDDENPTDCIFDQLLSIEPSLTKANQKIVPTLIKLFSDFKETLFHDLQDKFDRMVVALKEECTTVCNLKNEKIDRLEDHCKSLQEKVAKLEEKLEDEDAYIRRENLIVSGTAVVEFKENENCVEILRNVFREKLNVEVRKEDISVSHRLGRKPAAQGPDRRSLVVKFCRRDLKRDLLQACRRKKPENLYLNESLTPLRQKIAGALRRARKERPNVVSGTTTIDGRVFVWIKNGANDLRHCVNSIESLEVFCQRNFGLPAAHFLTQNS